MAEPSWDTYRRLIGARVRSNVSYRASFLMDLVTSMALPALDLLVILALFRVTRSIAGFGTAEILLMYGLTSVAFAVADLILGNIERLGGYVRAGLLDTVLVRPLPLLGQLASLDFALRRVGRVLTSALVLGLAYHQAGVAWTGPHVLVLAVTLVAGTVYFCALFVATATVAFWWVDSSEFANGFTYGGRDFATYPISVYNGFIRGLMGYAVGLGFVAYYPALWLLGRVDPLGLPAWLAWCTPVVAALAVVLAAVLWRFGVRHYRSTGS